MATQTITYNKGQYLKFKSQRCACTGGGWSEHQGEVVGIIHNQSGTWYQINTLDGIKTTKEEWILGIL